MIFPLFSLSWTLVAVGALLCGTLLGIRRRGLRPRGELAAAPRWRVSVKAAPEFKQVTDSYWGYKGINISQAVQVRLFGPGQADVLIATVKVTDDDYEQQITAALQNAEERAMTLNALVTA